MKILDDLKDRINAHLGTNSHVKLDPELYGTQHKIVVTNLTLLGRVNDEQT